MQIEVKATKREVQGTGASRRLRRAGRVPGIVYGGEAQPQVIELDHNHLFQHLRKEAFYSSVLNLNLDGAKRVVAYATHPVLSGSAIARIEESELDEVVVTDTIPLREDAGKCPRVRVVSISALLAETMLRISNEESVSSLFVE